MGPIPALPASHELILWKCFKKYTVLLQLRAFKTEGQTCWLVFKLFWKLAVFFFKIILFVYVFRLYVGSWLLCGLFSRKAVSRGDSWVAVHGLSLRCLLLLQSICSRHAGFRSRGSRLLSTGSLAVVHGLKFPSGIFLSQGWNPRLLCGQVDFFTTEPPRKPLALLMAIESWRQLEEVVYKLSSWRAAVSPWRSGQAMEGILWQY